MAAEAWRGPAPLREKSLELQIVLIKRRYETALSLIKAGPFSAYLVTGEAPSSAASSLRRGGSRSRKSAWHQFFVRSHRKRGPLCRYRDAAKFDPRISARATRCDVGLRRGIFIKFRPSRQLCRKYISAGRYDAPATKLRIFRIRPS